MTGKLVQECPGEFYGLWMFMIYRYVEVANSWGLHSKKQNFLRTTPKRWWWQKPNDLFWPWVNGRWSLPSTIWGKVKTFMESQLRKWRAPQISKSLILFLVSNLQNDWLASSRSLPRRRISSILFKMWVCHTVCLEGGFTLIYGSWKNGKVGKLKF